MLPEVENIDVPGLDHYFERDGLFYCWQQNNHTNHSGRWVITNNITNPSIACIGYYNGDYYRIDQAIEKYKTNFLEWQQQA